MPSSGSSVTYLWLFLLLTATTRRSDLSRVTWSIVLRPYNKRQRKPNAQKRSSECSRLSVSLHFKCRDIFGIPCFSSSFFLPTGAKSRRGRPETLSMPIRKVLQIESAQSRRRPLSHRGTQRLYQGTYISFDISYINHNVIVLKNYIIKKNREITIPPTI